ncbi:MAG TPA: PIG-L deacetylase family protein [Marmoricola sp.]|nr:PIG-L deacetylase family protein [Marmoricola sp.]
MFPIPAGCGPLLRVQVVVAHPDDETFGCGSLLLHAACAGAVTAVTCATRGEAGEVTDRVTVPEGGLAQLRESELREAARLLGVRHVDLLGFGDSGMAGEPGADTLVGAPFDDVLGAVERSVAAFRPDVLVTLDAGDGHRDHARIRDATVAVAERRGVPAFLLALPRSAMQRWAAYMSRVDPGSTYLHLGELGTPDEQVSVVLDTGRHLEQRWAAIRAHRSQTSPFENLPDDLLELFLTRDHLVAAR